MITHKKRGRPKKERPDSKLKKQSDIALSIRELMNHTLAYEYLDMVIEIKDQIISENKEDCYKKMEALEKEIALHYDAQTAKNTINFYKETEDLKRLLFQYRSQITESRPLPESCVISREVEDMLEDGDSNDTMRKCRLQIMSHDITNNSEFIEKALKYVTKKPNEKELTGFLVFLLAKRKPDFETEWQPLIIKTANHIDTDELAKIMNFSLVHFGAKKADELLSKLSKIVVPTPAFIEQATRIVTQNGGSDEKIRYLHETAIQKFGKYEPSVWINYCAFEVKNKNYKKVEGIRYRAVHTLEDSSEFQRLYHDQFCKQNEN